MTDMTKQTEAISTERALKLALEALEAEGDAWIVLERKAKAALREALTSVPDWASEAKEQPAPATELREQEPVTDRENAIIRFALHQFMSNAYSHMDAAAQDKDGRRYALDAVERFAKDAKDAEALLSRLQFKAPQPAQQQEPVATLWQHGETGRTRITMPEDITDCDARWFKAGWDAAIDNAVNLLMIQHEVSKNNHNYWHVAANLIKAELKEKNSD